MPEFPPKYITLSYDGPHGDREFVVACKGRPFSILTTPNFPISASTMRDFNLVRDLKIRMSELQCAKFHYGGHKLRILGKISTSVQCIKDGNQAGTLHLKATVVQDLYQTFETHSIAGTKLSEKFVGPPYHLSPKTEPSKDAPATPKRKKKKKSKNSPGSDSSPTTTHSPSGWTPPSSSHSTPTRSRSPPGFPTSPMYSPTGKGFPSSTFSPRVATCLPPPPEPPHNMHTRSPLSVNIALSSDPLTLPRNFMTSKPTLRILIRAVLLRWEIAAEVSGSTNRVTKPQTHRWLMAQSTNPVTVETCAVLIYCCIFGLKNIVLDFIYLNIN